MPDRVMLTPIMQRRWSRRRRRSRSDSQGLPVSARNPSSEQGSIRGATWSPWYGEATARPGSEHRLRSRLRERLGQRPLCYNSYNDFSASPHYTSGIPSTDVCKGAIAICERRQ